MSNNKRDLGSPTGDQQSRPAGFVSVQAILDGKIKINTLANVIGVLKDFRAPRAPMGNGTDWKAEMSICDDTSDEQVLRLNIFRSSAQQIPSPGAGDVIVIRSAKVQTFRGEISLITHKSTSLQVYTATDIPKPPESAAKALQHPQKSGKLLSDEVHLYVSRLYHAIEKPDAAEFEIRKEGSLMFKNKSSLLKDVRDDGFYDVIAQLVRDPYEDGDRVTLWIADYTQNSGFHTFDPSSYDNGLFVTGTAKWTGPNGRYSMQVTVWEPHAKFLSAEAKNGTWVGLRNLQVKPGHNGNNLEGFLREDPNRPHKVLVDILDLESTSQNMALKEAMWRKRDYEKRTKKQKNFHTNNKQNMDKSKANGTKNSKSRRKRKREEVLSRNQVREERMKDVEGWERHRAGASDVNELIKCENAEGNPDTIQTLLKYIEYKMSVNGQDTFIKLPFTNIKYRTDVRVVDYQPRDLKDFAVFVKTSEYDMLSDNSDVSDVSDVSDSEPEPNSQTPGRWQWLFALQVEDCIPPKEDRTTPKHLWVVVHDKDAEMLLNLDADNLHENTNLLHSLNETLFKLWGNLHEIKMAEPLRDQESQQRIDTRRPPESSDDEQSHVSDPKRTPNSTSAEDNAKRQKVSNKPFRCCIKQYGVQVPESDPTKADAKPVGPNGRPGKRWKRRYAMFGTKIS